MNKLLLFFMVILNSLSAQEIHYLANFALNEDEIHISRDEYFRFGKARSEIILIDYYQLGDTNCYRFTSSINALEIIARRPCAYIIEQNLMTYIFCEDSIRISDTLLLGKAFDQSLQVLQLPQRLINWKENAYFDCMLFYELLRIFDPIIIEYRYVGGKLIEDYFCDKRYFNRTKPKCILSGKYEDKCNCE
ncbi:MAG: hypothetical protein H0S84_02630 [Bacteroidales bacterium]|jgi:hypothetical protein|nr:hypothetical protein [Bacteroidales bacterium]